MSWQRDCEHQGTEALAMRIDCERSRDAAAKGVLDDEIQCAQLRQVIATDWTGSKMPEMCQHDFGRELTVQHLPCLVTIRRDRDVGGVTLVARAGMAEV